MSRVHSEAFGLDGLRAVHELAEDQFEMARRLIQGQHPVPGEVLVAVTAAKLSLSPLVAAVTAERGCPPPEWVGGHPGRRRDPSGGGGRAVIDEVGEPALRADGTPKVEVVERRERVGIAGRDIGVNVPKSWLGIRSRRSAGL